MNIERKSKIETSFSMASMTDMIFLLLVFFMLISNFVTPSGLPVNLPSSKASSITMQKMEITITKDLRYFINGNEVSLQQIRPTLASELNGQEGSVVLNIDKDVPVEHFVRVAGIANELKAKVSIATRPE
jgi:biopolymer transport protein ExbD